MANGSTIIWSPRRVLSVDWNQNNKPGANLPQERDFCRRRLARQKGPEDDVSAQRPEIGDHRKREMPAKGAFLLASYQLRVSEDWVVGTAGIEPVTR